MTTFADDIDRFNTMYGLPCDNVPSTAHLPVVPHEGLQAHHH